jgi:dihydropteroate synthase
MSVVPSSCLSLDPRRFPEGVRGRRVLFVTGRLAEGLVRRVVEAAAREFAFEAEVRVLGITVAALMHVEWVRRKLTIDPGSCDLVMLPGWCQGPVERLSEQYGVPVVAGPKEIQELPEFLGRGPAPAPDLSSYDIEIVAEINHAPRLTPAETLRIADRYRRDGADVIDVGCIPGESWSGVADLVRSLRAEGHRVSIDSFDRAEVEAAVDAGAELVLSCNASNRDWAARLPAELVVIPDDPARLETLTETAARLAEAGARHRLDPILEPVGFGFAAAVERYFEVRRRSPQTAMMMGVGNVTELAEVDSAGLNFLLAALCQELRIHSVLTTEVAPWCRSAVRELDVARRLVRQAVAQRVLVKRLPLALLLLRDRKVTELGEDALEQLARQVTDPNVRIFVDGGRLHLIHRDGRWQGDDPFELFDRFLAESTPVDVTHAFYLGYELAKAVTALTLGKQYTQDEPLRWGFLTREEASPRHRRESQE